MSREMTRDELNDHIQDVVTPMLEKWMAPEVREAVQENIDKTIQEAPATPGESVPEKLIESADEAKTDPNEGSGFGCFVRAICAARKEGGGQEKAASVAEKWGRPDVAKALASNNPEGGGFLVPEAFANEVIELRRATGTVRSLNPTVISIAGSGNLDIPRIAQGASASYGQENSNITKTEQRFGNLKLSFKKLSALVPISNDLLRYASPGVDGVVRDDTAAAVTEREDLAFIGDDGTSGKPKGILNWIHGDNKFDANSTVSLANVTVDLGKALQKLMDANIALRPEQASSVQGERAGWIFQPQIWQYLFTVQTGLGTHAFMPEMLRGTLLGFPFRVTTQASASSLGRTAADEPVIFGSFRHAVIGEAMGMSVDVSDSAAYHDGNAVVSAYSLDQTVLRVITEHDFALRHDKSFAVIESVTWGA